MACGIKRILTIQVSVKFRPILVFDEKNNDITNTCMYSWSTDTVCWTNWVDYKTYTTIGPNIEGDYYLRILLFGGFSNLSYDNAYIDCYSICLYKENPYTIDPCNGAVDFYANLDCALLMQQQMSDLVCCTLGIPCYYFRVTPENETKDYTFKEYVLHNVTDVKNIKLVLEDGSMPSSKPQMVEFDFDWDNDWEVEIGKTMFATAFGDTAFPKQRDIIYVPMMKRLYEVNSAYEEKQEQLMWRSTTWKLALVKWNEKTNVNQGKFEDVIDNWTINQIPEWLNQEHLEQERQTAIVQAETPTYSATNLYDIFMQDAIRKQLTESEKNNIISLTLNHGSNIVARNAYDFTDRNSVVVYQKPWCVDSGSLMMIVEANGWESETPETKTLFRAGDVEVTISSDNTIHFDKLEKQLENGEAYMIFFKWNRKTFTQSMSIYKYGCSVEGIPAYKIRPEMYRFDFEHPIYNQTAAYNNDYITPKSSEIFLSPAPYKTTNIKLYEVELDNESMIRESIKYTTSNEHCVFNDLSRPVEASHGYSVR